jgi:hypothetical protein
MIVVRYLVHQITSSSSACRASVWALSPVRPEDRPCEHLTTPWLCLAFHGFQGLIMMLKGGSVAALAALGALCVSRPAAAFLAPAVARSIQSGVRQCGPAVTSSTASAPLRAASIADAELQEKDTISPPSTFFECTLQVRPNPPLCFHHASDSAQFHPVMHRRAHGAMPPPPAGVPVSCCCAGGWALSD